jgi:nitrous oxidase accessory protein NosD
VDTLQVVNNIFEPLHSTGRRAFYVNPGVNHFLFSENAITGNFASLSITQAADGTVQDNVIIGTGAAGSRSAGIGTYGYPDPTVWGHTLFSGNTITGTQTGIAVYSTNDVSITGNTFTTNTLGVWVGMYNGLAFNLASIHVNNNSITDSDTAGVSNQETAALDAINNWWGGAAGPGGAGCDGVSGNVSFTPWLTVWP